MQIELQFLRELRQFMASFPNKTSSNLQRDVYNFFKAKCIDNEQDNLIISIGDEQLKAPRSLLAARSPVFAAMLTGKFNETLKNQVTLEDCDISTMQTLLTWIQYDKLPQIDDWNKVLALLLHADKFECIPVVEQCVCWLCALMCKGQCEVRDVIELREISLHLNCERLTRKCEQIVAHVAATSPKTLFETLFEGSTQKKRKLDY